MEVQPWQPGVEQRDVNGDASQPVTSPDHCQQGRVAMSINNNTPKSIPQKKAKIASQTKAAIINLLNRIH